MKRYGLPYQGSKNDIAQWVIDHLPPADTLIDAFAGGCAITHCALLSHKFKRVIANDVNDIPQLFINSIRGQYHDETRWISREDFFKLRDTDPYIRVCWSFGNDGTTYLYSKEIEPYKKALHYAVCFQDFSLLEELGIDVPRYVKDKMAKKDTLNDRRLVVRQWGHSHTDEIRAMIKDSNIREKTENEQIYRAINIERLNEIQGLERLQTIQGLERLQTIQGDYAKIPPPQGTYAIYCDPPYKGTDCGHYTGFDHERFYAWLRSLEMPAVISEYEMPPDFVKIDEKYKRVKRAGRGGKQGVERLFCHRSTVHLLPQTTLFTQY